MFFNKQDTNKYFQVPEDILKNEEISFINLISAKTGYNINKIKSTLDTLAKIHIETVHPNTQNNNRINYSLDLVVNTIKSKCIP